jgi:prepilin signal peptidase PulO-like enzyme (type II secretory pathway)
MGGSKMKERSFIGSLGILLYVVLSLIDRFFYKIPDYIYIPLMVLGIVIIIVGFVIDKKNNKK